ncbi:hypothetical protein XbrCFBP1976_11600 [Xanthomonas bromi]|uniref:Uncharacterized protein n=1 Tax=Xanthomonas bromi TaxID=56449 RepID=A0ABX5BNU5_9XANT|nr:hypothetical protein XbrCFBP1976_11600 [Xanthomonas bromi]
MRLRASRRAAITVAHAHAAPCLGRGMWRLSRRSMPCPRRGRREARASSTPVAVAPIRRISAQQISDTPTGQTRFFHTAFRGMRSAD